MRTGSLATMFMLAISMWIGISSTAVGQIGGGVRQEQVAQLLYALGSLNGVAADTVDRVRLVHHDVGLPQGVDGLRQTFGSGASQMSVRRVFRDGNFVVAHTAYIADRTPTVRFDLFRFENDLVVEHWNVVQTLAIIGSTGQAVIGGAKSVTDFEATASNKLLIRNFITQVFIAGRDELFDGYFNGDTLIQHSPRIADGSTNWKNTLFRSAEDRERIRYRRLHAVLGEGNFVLAISEVMVASQPTILYDLFRIRAGKLLEHWDVRQALPPQETWIHDAGPFAFETRLE
jgi:predicted SnoaL-like aldol condensation-catalyzing enzyme